MRNKNRRWLITWVILWTYLQLLYCDARDIKEVRLNAKNGTGTKETRGLFSPRMDYEQWKPILNGDPLKNDPTFDYVPPMVEAVRYWRDTSNRKSDVPSNIQNQKKDILLLGISSKKPSTSVPENPNRREYFDPFLKYVKETPYKESTFSYQRPRPHLPLTSPYFTPSQFLSKLTERPFISGNEAVPYTMLLPPPVPTKKPLTTIPVSTRNPSSVTVDQANLIFHSSTTGGLNDWLSEKYATTADSSNLVTWKTPVSREPIINNNIIDKQETTSPFVSMKNSTEEQIGSPVMHKGQVEDDEIDLANTYVNIGKLEAHMDSVSGMGISSISVEPPKFGEIIRPIMEPIIVNPMFTPKKPLSTITMQTLETMQTMQPPPIPLNQQVSKEEFNHANKDEVKFNKEEIKYNKEQAQFNSIKSILQNEITQPIPSMSSMFVTTMTPTTPIARTTTPIVSTPRPTTPRPTTTTASALTTDPLFKHYKQPNEPIRGPMYLIIQGHSKVKTYGPSKQIHGISIQETNEIPTSDDREFIVKHLHGYKKEEDRPRRNGRSGNLQTLSHVVQTGLGAIDFSEYKLRRKDDFQEAEREVEYKVSSKEEDVTERYLKGIVETGAIARKLRDV